MHHHHHNHHHSHDHDHHHHDQLHSFNRAFTVATIFNLAFCLVEVVASIIANSMSLLADAAHNFGDVLGLLLSWGAIYLVSKGSSERYSYGYKRTTILAAIINGAILVATSAIIVYESIFKLLNPQPLNEYMVIIFAGIGVFINAGSALLFRHQDQHQHDLNIRSAFLHLAYDALLSLSVVLGGILILFTGWLRVDPILGLFIVTFILIGSWNLFRDSVNLILDAVPRHIDSHAVIDFLNKIEGVNAVHDLHIWSLSTNEIALTAHLVMPTRNLSDNDYMQINQQLKTKFRIAHVTLQIERGDATAECHQAETC